MNDDIRDETQLDADIGEADERRPQAALFPAQLRLQNGKSVPERRVEHRRAVRAHQRGGCLRQLRHGSGAGQQAGMSRLLRKLLRTLDGVQSARGQRVAPDEKNQRGKGRVRRRGVGRKVLRSAQAKAPPIIIRA